MSPGRSRSTCRWPGWSTPAAEVTRLEGELRQAAEQRTRLVALLANPGFASRARPDVVERERARLGETEERLAQAAAAADALR